MNPDFLFRGTYGLEESRIFRIFIKEYEREGGMRLFESLCRTGSRTVASLFSRVSPGYLKSIIRTIARGAALLIKSKKMQGTVFFRIANYVEVRVEERRVKKNGNVQI